MVRIFANWVGREAAELMPQETGLQVRCWPSAESKLPWWALCTGVQEKAPARSVATYQILEVGVNLFKQGNHIWYSSCRGSRPLVKLLTVRCQSPRSARLLHRPSRAHHRCLFQVLGAGPAVPSGRQRGLAWAGAADVASAWPSLHNSPYCTGQRQLGQEENHRMGLGTHCETDLSLSSMSP